MSASRNLITASILAAAASGGTIDTPIFATVGDSRTQFAQQGATLTGATITRDAAGLITISKTNHGINGDAQVFIANPTDPTYAIMGAGHYVDANTYTVQSAVTGSAGSTTPGANCFAVKMSCLTGRGTIENLMLLLRGGIKFVGAFAQGGMLASAMGPECDAACATNADWIAIESGVNDIRGGATAAATASAVITLINKVTAAGKKAAVISINPQGSQVPSYGSYNDKAVAANAIIAAACNGTTSFFVDTNTGLTDTGTTSPNLAAWSWSVLASDGIHPHSRATYYIAQQVIAQALTGRIVTHDLLPATAATVPYAGAVPNTTIVRDFNLWPGYTSSTSGFYTGTTGTRGNNQNASRVVGSATTAMSILADPGDGLGAITRLVIQPAAANDRVRFWGNTSAETIAAAGLAVGDYFIIACQVYGYSNWDASQACAVNVTAVSNNSGTYCQGFGGNDGGTTEATVSGLNVFYGDSSGPFYLVSGVMKVHPSMTTVTSGVEIQFAGTTASQPLTIDLRGLTLIKLPLGY